MKQTAVEWLINEWLYLDSEFDMMLIDKKIYWERLREKHNQAKEMEKEQIINFANGWFKETLKSSKIVTIEQYYNETYGKDEK